MALTTLDPSKVLTGADGELWAGPSASQLKALAHVDEFTFTAGYQNGDIHPVGQYQVFAVPVSVMYRLSLTEPLVLDLDGASDLITMIAGAILSGCPIVWSFAGYLLEPCAAGDQAKIKGRVYFDKCVPDGDIDLFSIQPGQILRRRWNFRCNSRPHFQPA